MKSLRLLASALTLSLCGAAAIALACDGNHSTAADRAACRAHAAAAAAHAGCSAATATQTAAMRAQCERAAQAVTAGCPHAAASAAAATTAGYTGCAHGAAATTAAVTAVTSGCAHGAAAVADAHCPYSGATATAGGRCPYAGAAAVAMGCPESAAHSAAACAAHGAHATAVVAAGPGCAHKGAAGAASNCPVHGVGTSHGQCASCENWALNDDEMRAAGARSQVVPLKNGVMIVYTTDAPASVRSLQLSVARHQDRMLAALTSGDDGLLCTDCKSLRGALASGKLSPEVVNVEHGCMSLYTSPDPDVVQKIHVLTSAQFAAHVKS